MGFPSGRFTKFDPKNAPSRAYGSTGIADCRSAACVAGTAVGPGAGPEANAAGVSFTVFLSTSTRCFIPPVSTMKKEKRSEEHTSELQSRGQIVCRLLLEKKKQA